MKIFFDGKQFCIGGNDGYYFDGEHGLWENNARNCWNTDLRDLLLRFRAFTGENPEEFTLEIVLFPDYRYDEMELEVHNQCQLNE